MAAKEFEIGCLKDQLTDLKAENSMLADELNKVNGEYQHLIGNVAKLKEYLEAKKQRTPIQQIYNNIFKT